MTDFGLLTEFPSPAIITGLKLCVKSSVSAIDQQALSQKTQSEMFAFPNLSLLRKVTIKIPYFLIKDHKEKTGQEPHTVVSQSNEGSRVGRLFLFSGYCRRRWQP